MNQSDLRIGNLEVATAETQHGPKNRWKEGGPCGLWSGISPRFLAEAALSEDVMKAIGPEAAGERRHHAMNGFRRVVRALNKQRLAVVAVREGAVAFLRPDAAKHAARFFRITSPAKGRSTPQPGQVYL